MARRHADQLQDHPEPYRQTESHRSDGSRRHLRCPAEKGSHRPEKRAGEAAEKPWRYQRNEETAGRDLRRRPEERAHLRTGSTYPGHPADRYLRYELRSRGA